MNLAATFMRKMHFVVCKSRQELGQKIFRVKFIFGHHVQLFLWSIFCLLHLVNILNDDATSEEASFLEAVTSKS
jgi:hypothetical protein